MSESQASFDPGSAAALLVVIATALVVITYLLPALFRAVWQVFAWNRDRVAHRRHSRTHGEEAARLARLSAVSDGHAYGS